MSGMSTTVVIPPDAAARVPVQKPSQSVRPGSLRCTWALEDKPPERSAAHPTKEKKKRIERSDVLDKSWEHILVARIYPAVDGDVWIVRVDVAFLMDRDYLSHLWGDQDCRRTRCLRTGKQNIIACVCSNVHIDVHRANRIGCALATVSW